VPRELFDFPQDMPVAPPPPKPRKWGYSSEDGPRIDRSYDQSTEFGSDPVGTHVMHSSWGRGVIESTRGQGPNAVVTVRFDNGERKTIVARYLTQL
jgi:DNA helicase II / ATP-dependent DNA helicase PcrA